MRLLALGVLFCVVVASGHAASVYKSGIKREHCSWGAQYWCSSPKTAGLCKRTEWCSLHYWPYDMIEESSCTTAQQLVKNVRGFISTGDLTSDHEIALAIAKGCSVMKDDKLRHQCKGIVSTEEILKKLLHLVDSKLSSQSVAAAIGACKRNIPKELPKPCTTCVDVVTTAQKYFSKFFTLEMYNKLVEPQCTKLGQGQQLCQSFAAANYENFFNGIVSATPQEVCKYKTKCLAVSKELHRVQSDDICETCKTVVTDIRALDRDQGVQEAIRGLIKPVCAKIGEFKELCDTLADEGMEYVFEIIATEMEPDVVCAKLDLCGQSEHTKTSAKRIEISAVKEPGVAASASCVICELVMTKLDELISANSTEEELKSILDDVCNRLPGTVGQECLTFVNQYSPLIIKMLLQKLSPKLVCTALGLCKNSTGALPKQPHVQLTLKQPVKANDEICDLCDYVVKFLDAFLEKNNTEAEIEALLEKVCTILPGTLRQQCDTLVQQYGPVIIALLLSELQPDAVCAALGLCNKTRKELQMSRGHVSQSDDEVCNMCEFVVTYLDNFLNANSSEAQIEAVLDQVCNILPTSLKSECVALVKQYGPMIVKFLQQELSDPKQICTDLRLCSSAKVTLKFKPSAKKINPPSASNDQLCDLCQYVVTYLDTFLEKNTTLDEIEQLMDKVCAVLPSSVSQQCDTLVKQFGPMIIQLLLQEMQPKQVCTALKICTSKNHVSTGMVSEKPVSNDEICVLCEFLMKELDVWVSENSSVPEIEVALNKVCDLMPTTIKLECQQFVSQYTPAIIQLLVAKLAPEKVCQTLGLCSKRQVGVGSRKVKESPTCVLCEFVIKELDILISENRSLPEIEAALNKVCGLMPITIRSECQQFVNQYTPVIIQLLLSRLAPEKICQTIGLCSKMKLTVKSDAANIKQQKANDELCTVCEAVMKEVDAFLSENKTEAEIEAALDKVCDIMPASIKSQCEELLQQYAPVILQLMLQELQPQKICTAIGLCKSKVSPPTPKKANDAACVLCEFVMTKLDTILAENSTEAEIEAALDTVCNLLPSSVRTQCEGLIEQYAPIFLQLLLQKLKPEVLCTAIGLCKTTESRVITSPKVGSNDTCVLCEFVMSKLDTFLAKNSTEAEIEAALDKVCDILPASIKSECEQLLEQYAPVILQLLIQKLQPKQICTAIGLCNAYQKPVTSSNRFQSMGDSQCVLCEFVLKELDSVLGKESTASEVEATLDKVCHLLPSTIRGECQTFVDEYTPFILQILVQEIQPAEVCKMLGLCKASLKALPKKPDSVSRVGKQKTVACALCEAIMQALEGVLKKNSSKAEIIATLDKVCYLLPEKYKQPCIQFLPLYTDYVVELIEKEIPPKLICGFIKICIDDEVSAVQNQVTKNSVKKGELCPLCVYVFENLDKILESKSSEDDMKAALLKVCEMLPSEAKQQCRSFVEVFLPYVVDLVLQEVPPQQICQMLELCYSTESISFSVNKLRKTPTLKKGELCYICTYVFLTLDQILPENATEMEIEKALDQVCDFIPQIKEQCENLVTLYTPYVIDFITRQFTPKQICETLGLCGNSVKKVVQLKFSPKKSEVKKGELCPLCMFVMETVDKQLEKNATKEEIIAALDKVCDILPSTIKDQCESFVGLYLPYVVDLIVKELTPEQICQELGLCNSTTTAKVPKSSDLCELCKYVIQYLDNILEENSTEAQIEQALDIVCTLVPSALKEECEIFIKDNAEMIIQYLLQNLKPDLCISAGMCNNALKAGPQKLIEKHVEVTAGPECAICEYLMNYLDNLLEDNSTEQQIAAALEEVCTIVPATIRKDCVQFIASRTPQLIQMLLKVTPDQVCTYMRLCASKVIVSKPVTVGPQCPICEFVMKELDRILKKNATAEEIESALDKVCDILPSTVKQNCDQFVAQHTPALIQLLQHISPDQVCSYIGLCSTEEKDTVSKLVKSDTTCEVCVYVMKYLDSTLASNATEQEIESALDRVCNFLPASVRQECDQFVAQDTPILLQVLQELLSDQICSSIGLCSSKVKVQVAAVKGTEFCVICDYVMRYLEGFLAENATQQEIEAVLERICNLIPSSVKDECDQLISQYTPQLVQALLKFTPLEVCSSVGLCKNQGKVSVSKPVAAGPQCIICEYVMEYLEGILKENATEQEIESALERVCNFLPSTVKQECDQFVAQYTPVLIQLLQQVSPDQVCSYIGLCSSQKKESKPVKAGPQCTICEFVMKYLDSILDKNSTEQEIESALESVCNFLPSTVRQECDQFVSQYTPVLIQLLQQFSPDQVCSKIGLCSSQEKLTVVQKVDAGDLCVICEFVMKYLEEFLAKNATVQEIESALDKVCNVLPSTVRQECEQFVAQYTPLAIQVLEQKITPGQACTTMRLCTSEHKAKKFPIKPVQNGPTCTLCEFILETLDGFLSKNATVTEIEKALDIVCFILPSTLKTDCQQFISQYAPLIIQLLLQETRPRQVCIAAGLCTSEPSEAVLSEPVEKIPGVEADELCMLCEFIATELENLLSEKATEAEIESFLDNVCHKFEGAIQDECITFVALYTPRAIAILMPLLDPKTFCSELKLCKASVKSQTPKVEGPECVLCEFVMEKLKKMLSDHATEAEIEDALKKVCDFLPSSLESECNSFIDKYGPLIIKLLLSEVTPEEICTKLGLCTSKVQSETFNLKKDTIRGCTLCKFVMEEVHGLLEEPIVAIEVEKVLDKICQKLPQKWQTPCKELAEMFSPNIVSLIASALSPISFCQEIDLCEKRHEVSGQSMVQLLGVDEKSDNPTTTAIPTTTTPPPIKPDCSGCKFAMYELQTALADPYWQTQSKTVLYTLCGYFGSHNDVCKLLIDMNLSKMISEIRAYLFPIDFCQKIQFCEPPAEVAERSNSLMFVPEGRVELEPPTLPPIPTPTPPIKPDCSTCKFALYELQTSLSNPFWDDASKTILEAFCDYMGVGADVCKLLVDLNISSLLSKIRAFRFPIEFCQKAEFCEPPAKDLAVSLGKLGSTECELCQVLVQLLDAFLQKNSTETQVETFLEDVCNTIVPEEDRPQCVSIVKEYTPILMQLLSSLDDPIKVCQSARLCLNPSPRMMYKSLRNGGN